MASDSKSRPLEEKILNLPDCSFKTYARAALEAKLLVDRKIPASPQTPNHYRIVKVFELLEKIVDQYSFLEDRPESTEWSLNALNQAEEATCDAVRFLLRACG